MSGICEYTVGTVGAEDQQQPLPICGSYEACADCPVKSGGVYVFQVPSYFSPLEKHPNFPHEGNMYSSSVGWPMNNNPIIRGIQQTLGLTVEWLNNHRVLSSFGYDEPLETLCRAGQKVNVVRKSVRKVE